MKKTHKNDFLNINKKSVSNRNLRSGELIKHALAEIFIKENFIGTKIEEKSITISEVRSSPDLKSAYVYVIDICGLVEKKILLEVLKDQSSYLRNLLAKKIYMKYVPKLIFKYDDSFDRINRLNNIFEDIKK